jgi:hypothetical protein
VGGSEKVKRAVFLLLTFLLVEINLNRGGRLTKTPAEKPIEKEVQRETGLDAHALKIRGTK